MKNNEDNKDLRTELVFDAIITIQPRTSKTGNIYEVMCIGVKNNKTGETLNIYEVYIKENLRQLIEFILNMNK